jgi:hypothetical protein
MAGDCSVQADSRSGSRESHHAPLDASVQIWQRHRPFASWWPVVLAIPIAWALLLPETLACRGSVRFWLILGTWIAMAFTVPWLALGGARQAME